MKKFLLLLVCCLTLVGLSGCSLKAIGTWELSEVSFKVGPIGTTVKAGESYLGMEIDPEFTVITLKLNGTGTIVLAGSEPTEVEWEAKDGIIKISDEDGTIEAKLEDDFLVFESSFFGMTAEYKLAKAK